MSWETLLIVGLSILSLAIGGKLLTIKNFLKESKELLQIIDEALNNNALSKEELQMTLKESSKIIKSIKNEVC